MARIVKPAIMSLQETARRNQGGVNGALNQAACALSHFVPEFFSVETAMGWLTKALGPVPEGGQPQNIERFRRILDGREPIRDAWRAELVTPDPLPEIEPASTELAEMEYQRLVAKRTARDRLAAEDAIARASDASIEGFTSRFLDSEALDSIEDLEPLIDEWLYLDSTARLVAPSGSFKSFLALDMACSVACGRDWWGSKTTGGSVVYVVAEGVRGVRKRVRAWEMTHLGGADRVQGLHFLPEPVQILGPEWTAFVGACVQVKARLIILDTQARCTVGVPENDNTELGRVHDQAEKLRRETGACVLIVHHTGYDRSHARGGTVVYGGLQTELSLERREGSNEITLTATKQKDSEPAVGTWKLVPAGESLVLANLDGSDKRDSADARVADALTATLSESMSVREQLARCLHECADGIATGVTKAELIIAVNDARARAQLPTFVRSPKVGQKGVQTLHTALTRMEKEGHVERPGVRYRLSEGGCAAHGLSYTDLEKVDGE